MARPTPPASVSQIRTRLYELADELHRIAPWQWMMEYQLIGIRHPGLMETGHISVMGAAGRHCSVAVYLGDDALHRFNLIQHGEASGVHLGEEDMAGVILESRQLQANFALRNELFPSELAEIKSLGRKYRGESWPCFRSFKPGRAPDPVNDEEAVGLAHALEQLTVIAPTLRGRPNGAFRARRGVVEKLAREFRDGAWHTSWLPSDERLFELPSPAPSRAMIETVRALKASAHIACQFQLIPSPVGATGKSAVFPYLLICADRATGIVYGVEMLSVEGQSHESMIASVPDHFLRLWDRAGVRPASLWVSTLATRAVLEKTAAALKVPLRHESHLPSLHAAIGSLMEMMAGRML